MVYHGWPYPLGQLWRWEYGNIFSLRPLEVVMQLASHHLWYILPLIFTDLWYLPPNLSLIHWAVITLLIKSSDLWCVLAGETLAICGWPIKGGLITGALSRVVWLQGSSQGWSDYRGPLKGGLITGVVPIMNIITKIALYFKEMDNQSSKRRRGHFDWNTMTTDTSWLEGYTYHEYHQTKYLYLEKSKQYGRPLWLKCHDRQKPAD